MTNVKFDLDGDSQKLISELRKVQQTIRDEGAERRRLDHQSRKMEADERKRLRDRIVGGREQKKAQQELGKIAAAAMKQAKNPTDEYTRAIHLQQQALDAGTISLEQFKQRKFALLRTLRDAKREQSGENAELKEAASLVNRARTSTQQYEQRVKALGAALRRGKIDQDQYAAGMRLAKSEMEGAAVQGKKWFGSLAAGVGSVVGITSAVGAATLAISQLRAEYDNLIERQKLARDAQVTLAEAQEQAAFNLGDDPTMNVQQLFGRVRKESQALGISEKDLTKAVSDALSARGDESASKAVDAVVAAAKLRRFAPEELPMLAGSSLDISKRTGKNVEESLGFLLDIGTLSRVTNLQNLATHAAPGVVGGTQFGVSGEFSGAMFAALSQGIVDPSGRTSRTTQTRLLEQLRQFGGKDQAVEETFIQVSSDPRLREMFLADKSAGGFGATFDAKGLAAVEGLLTSGSKVNLQFADALTKLRASDSQKRFDRTVTRTESLPAVQTALVERAMKNAGEQFSVADQVGAISGAIREGLDDLKMRMGESNLSTRLASVMADLNTGGVRSIDSALKSLGEIQTAIENPTEVRRTLDDLYGFDVVEHIPRPMTAAEQSQAAIIKESRRQLEKVAALIAQNEAQKAQQAGQAAPAPLPAPVQPDPDVARMLEKKPVSDDVLRTFRDRADSTKEVVRIESDEPERPQQQKFAIEFPEVDQKLTALTRYLEQQKLPGGAGDIVRDIRSREPERLTDAVTDLQARKKLLLTPDVEVRNGQMSEVPNSVTGDERRLAEKLDVVIQELRTQTGVVQDQLNEFRNMPQPKKADNASQKNAVARFMNAGGE